MRLDFLEAKALWLLAVHGSKDPPAELARDPELTAAGERAIGKTWRHYLGIADVCKDASS